MKKLNKGNKQKGLMTLPTSGVRMQKSHGKITKVNESNRLFDIKINTEKYFEYLNYKIIDYICPACDSLCKAAICDDSSIAICCQNEICNYKRTITYDNKNYNYFKNLINVDYSRKLVKK